MLIPIKEYWLLGAFPIMIARRVGSYPSAPP